MKEIFLIGEMAILFKVNISTLRYYDEIGLFYPHTVDVSSNYRSYHISQFELLNTIIGLKTLGITLKEIKLIVTQKSMPKVKDLLERQLSRTQNQLIKLRNIEHNLIHNLDNLSRAQRSLTNKVEYRHMSERTLVELMRESDEPIGLDVSLKDLEQLAGENGLVFTGRYGLGITNQNLHEKCYKHNRVFLFVDLPDLMLEGWVTVEAGMYATFRFIGTHEETHNHYGTIMASLKTDGYEFIEDAYEVVLVNNTIGHGGSVIEVQLPVVKIK